MKAWNGTCAAWSGEFVDTNTAPGAKCKAVAVGRRKSGTYTVPVCEAHSSGRVLYRLGSQFFGLSA